MILIPALIFVWFSVLPERGLICAGIFGFAAITDWLDGFIARHLNQHTDFGAFLDPVADKLLVSSSLILLSTHFDSLLFTLASIVIISREILISSIRQWMSVSGQKSVISVSFLGKIKTFIQMIAIVSCFGLPYQEATGHPGVWLLLIATIFTLVSLINYLRILAKALTIKKLN